MCAFDILTNTRSSLISIGDSMIQSDDILINIGQLELFGNRQDGSHNFSSKT